LVYFCWKSIFVNFENGTTFWEIFIFYAILKKKLPGGLLGPGVGAGGHERSQATMILPNSAFPVMQAQGRLLHQLCQAQGVFR
jgi:hypothetical protein